MQNLDTKLAYKAMFRFLEKYHALTNADDIGSLLGSMSMDVFHDAMPADPAMWEDWLAAIREVRAEQSGMKLNPAAPDHPAHRSPSAA